ncbi:DUF3866 family protein [Paenibacillus mesophilus]|uniref:DUF3866 family protein n=1 Tax=Paenibacillus mesophilus TaxID=2582849 RepID=UPI00130547E2|nr:DUF3866 family protein [Paenibacillus mesophilus]
MIVWQSGTVTRIASERGCVQEVDIAGTDGETMKAIHYTDVMRPLRVGDRVKLNATAEALHLGSGGYHFVYEVCEENWVSDDNPASEENRRHPGHIMKLRYTPSQRAVLSVEEQASPHHAVFAEPRTLGGMPVLIGELHSMLPIASVWIRGSMQRAPRVSYVMTEGGALPISFSRHVATLRDGGWLCGTITYGHAYGGELEAVNKYTALLAARHVQGADIAIAVMGPGIAGTGTPYGHTATELAELIHAVHALGGTPIVIPRVSFADPRARHFGVSAHLLHTLGKLALVRAAIPFPDELLDREKETVGRQLASSGCAARHDIVRVPDVSLSETEIRLASYPVPITTMGRGLRDDPSFYMAVCAAAQTAVSRVRGYE